MLTPEEQMQIIKGAITQNYQGPIYELIDQANRERAVQAETDLQKEQGLKGSPGNESMLFHEASGDFNTVGMDFPIDIHKYDHQGNLVRSYNKVPPGIKKLSMGDEEGTVIETPSQYQDGGFYNTISPHIRFDDPTGLKDKFNYNVKERQGDVYIGNKSLSDKPFFEGQEPSTHMMKHEYVYGKGWVAFPTLFQDEDGLWEDLSQDDDWNPAYEKALDSGEVYYFGEDFEQAKNFAEKGTWKKEVYQKSLPSPPSLPSDQPKEEQKFEKYQNKNTPIRDYYQWEGFTNKGSIDEKDTKPTSEAYSKSSFPVDLTKRFAKDIISGKYKRGGRYIKSNAKAKLKEEGGETETQERVLPDVEVRPYQVKIIQYPYGYEGGDAGGTRSMQSGHLEAMIVDMDGNPIKHEDLPVEWQDTKYKTYVNRWVNTGNEPIVYRDQNHPSGQTDYEEGVRTVIMSLSRDELDHFMTTAQTFKPGEYFNLGDINSDGQDDLLPTQFGEGDEGEYDFLTSNCADGVCHALGLDDDQSGFNTAGVTDPTKVMDYLISEASYDKYVAEDTSEYSSITGVRKDIDDEDINFFGYDILRELAPVIADGGTLSRKQARNLLDNYTGDMGIPRFVKNALAKNLATVEATDVMKWLKKNHDQIPLIVERFNDGTYSKRNKILTINNIYNQLNLNELIDKGDLIGDIAKEGYDEAVSRTKMFMLQKLMEGLFIKNWEKGGVRKYDNGGVGVQDGGGSNTKFSIGAEGNVNCLPGVGGCGGYESPLTLKPNFAFTYDTNTEHIGVQGGADFQTYLGGFDTRHGAPTLSGGITGGIGTNPTTKELETSKHLTLQGKMGFKRRNMEGAHDWSSFNPGWDAGIYGKYDIINKRAKDVGIYGSYGPLEANIGYDVSDKVIRAGLGLKLGKRKKGGMRIRKCRYGC